MIKQWCFTATLWYSLQCTFTGSDISEGVKAYKGTKSQGTQIRKLIGTMVFQTYYFVC